MTPPLFFVNEGDLARATPFEVDLSGEEGRHALRVRRLRVGEELVLADGFGASGWGSVAAVVPPAPVRVRIERVVSTPAPCPHIVIAQAAIKGERMDRALETLTESGVDEILVWDGQRSIARTKDRRSGVGGGAAPAPERMIRKVREAAKQARRPRVPAVEAGLTLTDVLARAEAGVVVVLDEVGTTSLADHLPMGSGASVAAVTIIVGPEGGFSDQERQQLSQARALSARVGPAILRASTAGTYALGWVMAATGRWELTD